MTFPLHTQQSLDALTWNEIQKLHSSLGLKATAATRSRRDYQRRIVEAQPQPVVEPEHTATALTCAACPFAVLLEGKRYECGAHITDAVTRGHWEAKDECYTEIAAEVEAPITPEFTATETESPIAQTKRAMPFFFNLPLPEYVAFSEKQSVPCCIESTTRDRAKEYKKQLRLAQQGYKVYGGNQPSAMDFWQFHAYLQLVNPSATYTEVIENADSLDATECLEFIIATECPFIFHELEDGKDYFNYAPRAGYVWATDGCRADIGTNVTMQDSIHAIAERIRSCLDEFANSVAPIQPAWYIEMMNEIREYQQTLPDAPKPSKLYTKLCQEMEVGDYLKTDYAVTRRRTQVVAAKEALADGRIHFILNCGISHREIFSQEVWLDAPISLVAEKSKAAIEIAQAVVENNGATVQATAILVPLELIAQPALITPELTATTTDDAPPNRGYNGRGRISATTPSPAPDSLATIAQTPRAKADDNFMTAFTNESEFERKFNNLAYLSELEMKTQQEIERTVIGSEEEAIAYRHLRAIKRDIEFYGKPKSEPQPSPAVAQLETQMAKFKAEVKQQFTIDTSILTVEKFQSAPASLDPEGTIHWHGPLQGTITGKKGTLRNFYFRSRNCLVGVDLSNPATYEIMLVVSADFTAAEDKRPNVRHQQIRSAIEAGRAFDPIAFKDSPQFKSATEDCGGIGRIMQGCDGRWWAWATDGLTGHSFADRATACKYLEKVSQNQRQ